MDTRCEYCGKEFIGREGARFCSNECRSAYHYRMRKYGTIKDTSAINEIDNETNDAENDDDSITAPFTERDEKIISKLLTYVADYSANHDMHQFCVNVVNDFPLPIVYRFAVIMNG